MSPAGRVLFFLWPDAETSLIFPDGCQQFFVFRNDSMQKEDVKADGQKDNDQPLIYSAVMPGQQRAGLAPRKELFQDGQCIKSRKDTRYAKRKYILIQDGL